MYPDPNLHLNYETDDTVYFFTGAFYPFDNFSAHSLVIWGRTFPTLEHAFQWKKFSVSHPEIAESIFQATSPDAVKKISDAHKPDVLPSWDGERVEVMEFLLRIKIEQHEDVQEMLKKTGSKMIVENSPVDSFWGCGPNKDGKNVVGNLWIKIRNELIKKGELS